MRDLWEKLKEIHKIHGKANLVILAGSGVQCFPPPGRCLLSVCVELQMGEQNLHQQHQSGQAL